MKDRYLDPKANLTIKKVFGELPKFTSHSMSEQKMQWLWLRFMTEIGDNYAQEIPTELLAEPLLNKAVFIIRESAYNEAQLLVYDVFGIEKALVGGAERKGREIGKSEGILAVAHNMKSIGFADEVIMQATGLSSEEIKNL